MRQTYRPLTFFSLSLLIPWLLWFTAAYISHHQPSKTMLYIQTGLSIIGLVSPMLLALWLLRSNPSLRADAANRLLKLGGFPPAVWPQHGAIPHLRQSLIQLGYGLTMVPPHFCCYH